MIASRHRPNRLPSVTRDCREIPWIHIPTRSNPLRDQKSRCSWRRKFPAIGGRNLDPNRRSESCYKTRCTKSSVRPRKTRRCLTSPTFRLRVAPTRVIASRGRCSLCTRTLREVWPLPWKDRLAWLLLWKDRPVWKSSHGTTYDKRQIVVDILLHFYYRLSMFSFQLVLFV